MWHVYVRVCDMRRSDRMRNSLINKGKGKMMVKYTVENGVECVGSVWMCRKNERRKNG